MCVACYAETTNPNALDIGKLMTKEQYEASGLTKLSEKEQAALNQWLMEYTLRVAKIATDQQSARSTNPAEALETAIDGEFSGWDGDTIFKLKNGQIWQQSAYAYKYHYAYSPKVIIYKSGTSYKMKVDDVDGEISVKRIK